MEAANTGSGKKMFPHIFAPAKLGKFNLKNHVKWAACSISNMNTRDGFITERELARDKAIAETGAAILTNQGAYPDPRGEGKAYYRQTAIYDDKFLPQFKKIVDMFHDNDAVAIQQITHCGRYGGVDMNYCIQPSAVPQTLKHFNPPREMSREDIKQNLREHVDAVKRCMKVGFDGVEFTGFMGYMLANFLSKFTNRRTDEYGGSLINRTRFVRELLEASREVIGPDRLLTIRLNGTELLDEFGGLTEEECLETIKIIAETGLVDMISLVVGWQESRSSSLGKDVPVDGWVYLARNAKKVIGNVPLSFGVRLEDVEIAERCMANGDFDFWEVCRPGLADPQFLHKIEQGRLGDVRPCLGCVLCLGRMFRNLPYICTANPRIGHEYEPEYQIRPAVASKTVAVIGGGLAGAECAITAAQRGHRVTLYEKEERIGGQIWGAVHEPMGERELKQLIQYYENQLEKFGVEVRLSVELTEEKIRKELSPNVDVGVVATGSFIDRSVYQITPGARVFDCFELFKMDNLKSKIEGPAIVVGGGKVGSVTAEYLSNQGYKVTLIVEQDKKVGWDLNPAFMWRHPAYLHELKVNTIRGSVIKEINSEGVVVKNTEGEKTISAGAIVLCSPRRARNTLLDQAEFLFDELYIIGDAVSPRGQYQAIHDGFRLGVRI